MRPVKVEELSVLQADIAYTELTAVDVASLTGNCLKDRYHFWVGILPASASRRPINIVAASFKCLGKNEKPSFVLYRYVRHRLLLRCTGE